MTEEKVTSTSNGVSRRKMIKGVAATALASGLISCQEKPQDQAQKPCGEGVKQTILTQKCDPNAHDHTGMLGVWLALVRDGRYCDRGAPTGSGAAIGTWDMKVSADSIAGNVVPDMFPSLDPKSQAYADTVTAVSKFVTKLRNPLPNPPGTYQDLYIIAGNDLGGLSTGPYTGTDCPKLYATIVQVAKVAP